MGILLSSCAILQMGRLRLREGQRHTQDLAVAQWQSYGQDASWYKNIRSLKENIIFLQNKPQISNNQLLYLQTIHFQQVYLDNSVGKEESF